MLVSAISALKHVDLSIRQTVPDAFEKIRFMEVASLLRNLRPIKSKSQVQYALLLLESAVPTLSRLNSEISSITEIEKDEKVLREAYIYQQDLKDANWALVAAMRSLTHILSPNGASELN